ncbi:hypothetical protein [Aureitalea marina]|uniref:Uncharacterized protein n=1 Tax=Aureitalea marina TaxID=930804 RepID=A0A2S7KPN9_9FLAO|nr:hypothetical protein [Aureitalea marina]PQB04581.1 hypothetical protein BST85_06465 [Aureitalea marina]
MKNLVIALGILLVIPSSFSQVGINATDPQRTIDVNGMLRVRDLVLTTNYEKNNNSGSFELFYNGTLQCWGVINNTK